MAGPPLQQPRSGSAAPVATASRPYTAPAFEQRLQNATHRANALQTSSAADTQQRHGGMQPGIGIRNGQPSAAMPQQRWQGAVPQNPGQLPAPAVGPAKPYASRPPVGGPHVRRIFYKPKPAAEVPNGANMRLASTAAGAHGGNGLDQYPAQSHLGHGQHNAGTIAAQPAARLDAGNTAVQLTSRFPQPQQQLVLPSPNAKVGSYNQHANTLRQNDSAGQMHGNYPAHRVAQSAPAAAQSPKRRVLPDSHLRPGPGQTASRGTNSAPAATASHQRPAIAAHQQQRHPQPAQQHRLPSPQKQQHVDSSGTTFQRFACDAPPRSPACKAPDARSAPQPASAATSGATKQQGIVASLMHGGARPVPPRERPGNELCFVEIQLGGQTGTLEVHAKDRYFNDAAQAAMLRRGIRHGQTVHRCDA